jgi:hypothetical protein
MNYRNKTTGNISTQGEIRRANPNKSFPKVWNEDVLTILDIDVVFSTPRPDHTSLETVVSSDAVQDALGNWTEGWAVQDLFSDTTTDGVTTTKAEHEAAFVASENSKVAEQVRKTRDSLLKETDWAASSDLTMSSDMTAYRQALRDVSDQAGFPNTIIWPTGV